MTESWIEVCEAADLVDGGKGVRFPVTAFGAPAIGFAVRFDNAVYGYLNRCAHVPIELDWMEGDFFESSGLYLMCQTHGAIYAPESGKCMGGPCRGGELRPITVAERDGKVFWQPDDNIRPALA